MPATMESAATMESSTAVESTTGITPAHISAPFVPAIPTSDVSTAYIAAGTVVGVPAWVVTAVAVVSAVIPRTCADEDTIKEPIRPVIAVWSAGVRVIIVVAIGACGRAIYRWPIGSHADAH